MWWTLWRMAPDVSLLKDLLPHLLRTQSRDNLQILASSLITSAAKNHLMQGHTPSLGSPHPMNNEKEGIYRPGHLSTTPQNLKHHLCPWNGLGLSSTQHGSSASFSDSFCYLVLTSSSMLVPKSFPKKHQKG